MHKFKIGQMVDFTDDVRTVSAPERGYKVLGLIQQASGARRYCIKSIIEPFTRIADEGELAFNIPRRPRWHEQQITIQGGVRG